jgi:hypothetical protein
MTPRWRQLFNEACNFTCVVSPGSSFWPSNMFEPLWAGIVLPLTHHRPWCFKRAPLLVELEGTLRELLKTSEEDAGNLLRKLLGLPGWVASLLQHMACRVLHVPWSDANIPNAVNSGRARKCLAQGGGAPEKIDRRGCGSTPVYPIPVWCMLDEEHGGSRSKWQRQVLSGMH